MSFHLARKVLAICLICSLILGAVFLLTEFPERFEGWDNKVYLIVAVLLLSLSLVQTLFAKQARIKQTIKLASIWIGIGFVTFAGFTFKEDVAYFFSRLVGELVPGHAQDYGSSVLIRAGNSGHYSVWADVDGARVRFLIDTGATHVVLSPKDAALIGFDLSKLTYSNRFHTANGTVKGAPVVLETLTIGSIQLEDVRAFVNGADMGVSLLGMSYLNRLSGFEVNGNVMTLTP